jgi:hypothetical protein
MANITIKDLTSIIQDLSDHELNLHGGLCGVLYTIRLGGRVFTTGGMCRRVSPTDWF